MYSMDPVDILIVAEKPSVAEAFAKALAGRNYVESRIKGIKVFRFKLHGKRWASIGLKGHLFNFDFEKQFNSWRRVDPKVLFFTNPIRVVEPTSRRYLEALKEIARHAELIYLALDADTEGESIAFEVMDVVRSVNPYAEFKRLWFNSTVPEELRRAISNPQSPNRLLAEKCFARMIVDLTIGAAFTRFITRAVEKKSPRALPFGHFLSYGPCQSPTLFLVVQRAWEREKFKPEKFYVIKAKVEIYGAIFEAEHAKGQIKSKSEADAIYSKIKGAKYATVEKFRATRREKKPPIPLTTLELESRASKYLNIRAKQALDVAEELYRRGYISYPRTETEIYSPKLNLKGKVEMLAKHPIYGDYAQKILNEGKIRPTRGTRDDKAHPPIHPTRAAEKDEIVRRFGSRGWRIYDLIVRHFLATLSSPATIESRRADLNINGEKFIIRGLTVADEGYLKIYPFEKPKEDYLPELEKGNELKVISIEVKEGETSPPPFLSEAELLKLMDKYGIGTDATKQDHIHTNIKRGYFYIEKKRCIPTPLGKTLIEALYKTVPEVVKPEVRGFMEKMFSEIALGKRSMNEVVESARKYFLEKYEILREHEGELALKVTPSISESIAIARKSIRRGRRRWRRRRRK